MIFSDLLESFLSFQIIVAAEGYEPQAKLVQVRDKQNIYFVFMTLHYTAVHDKVDNGHKEAVRLDFDMVPALADFREDEAEADRAWIDPYGEAVGQDWQVGTFPFPFSKFMFIILGSHA